MKPTKPATNESAPFATGHEHESVTAHLGSIHNDTKDGFGNALADKASGPNADKSFQVGQKLPPAF